jgi:alkanesulfonate monooxygenase SsuD/methylene tetrahydromethanopterin reductase-like flavin-dependent oxidoreductase (luciferase family)
VNQVLAYHSLALLTRLFRHGRIEHHGGFVSVVSPRVVPVPVSPALWRRMSHRGAKLRIGA